MTNVETKVPADEKVGSASIKMEAIQAKGWRPSAIVADIATLGTGTLLAALFNGALIFVVPKLISVEDYGYWKMFGLYSGYAGFVHLGFADGALLRWAGRPLGEFHREIAPAVKYLFWQHLIVLTPLCAIGVLVLPQQLWFVGIAVAVYALVFNLVTVLQFGLQSAKIFRPVAISAVAAPALLLAFVLLWRSKWQSGYREVTSFDIACWLVVLVFLLAWVKPWGGKQRAVAPKGLAKACIMSGWPIVMANTGAMLVASADRLALSWAATIQNFAQYSLAASAMAVPITAIQACSSVFFSHLAGITPEGRRQIYGVSSRALLVVWAVLLPYYFALDFFVRHFLPRYVPSLAFARVLLLGIPFLAAIQILQMSYAYLNGMQRRFLAQTTAVLVVSLGGASFAAFHTGSLRIVAGVQVVILAGWWLFNEWNLRRLTGETAGAWMKFLGTYLLASGIYWMVTSRIGGLTVVNVTIYYLSAAVLLVVFYGNDLRLLANTISGRRSAFEVGESPR